MDFATLQSLAAGGDYFALLCVPHKFDVDLEALRRNYLELSRQTHPDFFAGDPEKLPEVLAVSATVNDAFRTLEDPVRRAEYVLLRHGGKNAAEDKRVPPQMLGEVLMMREEIEEARASGDTVTLATFKQQLLKRRKDILAVLAELAGKLTAHEPAAKGDEATLDALRLELNAMKYVDNLLAQL